MPKINLQTSQDLVREFKLWLIQQPDDVKYDYSNIYDCVLCRFLGDAGYPNPNAGGLTVGWGERIAIIHFDPVKELPSEALQANEYGECKRRLGLATQADIRAALSDIEKDPKPDVSLVAHA